MSVISKDDVLNLREKTGAGLIDCKRALIESNGNLDEAVSILRKKGVASAAKKAGRDAGEGIIAQAVSGDNRKGILVEVNCETDFVAKNEDFVSFASEVASKLLENSECDLETARTEQVAKIGENISVRRVVTHEAEGGIIGGYVHGNNRIAVLVSLKGGSEELARDVAMHVAAVNPQVVSPDDMPEDLVAKEREIYTAQAQDSGKPPEIVEKMIDGRIRKFLAENSLTEQAFVKDPDTTVGKLVAQAGAEVLGFTRFEVGEGIEVEKVDFASEVAAQLGN